MNSKKSLLGFLTVLLMCFGSSIQGMSKLMNNKSLFQAVSKQVKMGFRVVSETANAFLNKNKIWSTRIMTFSAKKTFGVPKFQQAKNDKHRNNLWQTAKSTCAKGRSILLGLGFLMPIFVYSAKRCSALPQEQAAGDQVFEQNRGAILGSRPPQVQAAADRAFENIKNVNNDEWFYKGTDYYTLLDLDEDKILKNLAYESRGKKDIYIIDVGCAGGNWGRRMMNALQGEVYKKSGKRFHIFSVTGGKECEDIVQKKEHVTLYQFNQFKIENLDEEFSRRGFDLRDKVDLIVSSWTLRHLVDPFGTLKQMYNLLTPSQGKLMSNGFLFMFNDSTKVESFPLSNENILVHSNATILFKDLRSGRDVGQFLLVRNDENELKIPLEYTDKVYPIGYGFQNESYVVTVYSRGSNPSFDQDYIDDDRRLYCNKGDQRCKKLYRYLSDQRLFYEKA